MSEPAPEAPARGKKENLFTRKIGPLPMWVWLLIGVAVILGWAYWQNRKNAAAQQNATPVVGAGQVPEFVNQTFVAPSPPSPPGQDIDKDHDKHGPPDDDDHGHKPPDDGGGDDGGGDGHGGKRHHHRGRHHHGRRDMAGVNAAAVGSPAAGVSGAMPGTQFVPGGPTGPPVIVPAQPGG